MSGMKQLTIPWFRPILGPDTPFMELYIKYCHFKRTKLLIEVT